MIFNTPAEVSIGAGQAVVSKVTVNADVTFKGDSVASGKGLFFDKMTGTGKVTFDGVYVGIISAGNSRNFTIDNDICIASDCTFFTGTLICYANGDITGDGALTVNNGNNGGVYFYGDNSAFAGSLIASDTTRNNTGFYNGNATSSNAIFKLNSNQYNINQESTFHDSGTYYFGALLEGTFLNGAYRSPTLEVGARDDVASSAKLQGRGTTTGGSKYYFNIVKVGSNSFTVTADSSNFGDMEIKGGTLSLPSVPSYGTYVKFTGDGATLTATANSESVIPELDFSAKIMNSTSAICYDTAGSSPTWATALANSNTGGLTKKGAGTLTLSAIPWYSGETRVEEGTLVVPLGTQLGDVYVAEGATLTFDLANTTMIGALATFTSKTGDGEVTLLNAPEGAVVKKAGSMFMVVSGARTLTWAGPTDDDYSRSTASNWTVGGEAATSAPTAVDDVVFETAAPGVVLTAAAEALSVTAPNGLTLATAYDLIVYDDFTVTGAFVKSGKGTLAVEGTLSATGGATITGGAVEGDIDSETAVTFAPVALSSDNYAASYGAKVTLDESRTFSNFSGSGTIVSSADQTYSASSDATFAGAISGNGGFTKTGAGTLTLIGNQTFAGDVTVNEGGLKLGTIEDIADIRYNLDASADDAFTTDEDGNITAWKSTVGNINFAYDTGSYIVANSSTLLGGSQAAYFGTDYSTSYYSWYKSSEDQSSRRSLTLFIAYQADSDMSASGYFWGQSGSAGRAIQSRYSNKTWYASSPETTSGYYINGTYGNGYGAYGSAQLLVAANTSNFLQTKASTYEALGATTQYNAKNQQQYGFKGLIGQVTAFRRVLTMEEKQAAEAYLMAKWGINNATYAALPATADVTVAAGATLDLGGQTVTVASLNLSGTIQNGTLVVTSDNITIAATAKVLATVKVSGYDSSMTAPTGFEFSDNSDGTATLVDVRTYTWNGESGNWSDASNWNCGVAPTWRNSVVFPSGTYTVSFSDRNSSGDACWNVTINGNVTFARTVWSYLDIHENIDGSGKLTLTNMGVNNCLDNTCMTISCELEVDNSQNYSQDSYFIGWNGTTYAVTGAFEASGIVNFFRPVTITGELTLDDGVNLAAGEGTTVTIGNAIVPASASATLSGSGSIAITGTVTLQGTGSTLTVPAGANVSGATFTTSVSGYEVVENNNVYSLAVGTTVAPNATSIEYATEEEATTAAAGYTVALTKEQTEQGLQASYYEKAVVPGATEGTYVVTAKLSDAVMPVVDEGVTVTTTTVTLPVTNLKPGLCYRVVYGDSAGAMNDAGAWSEFYDGENAPVLQAALPASGVLYYAIEAADTK